MGDNISLGCDTELTLGPVPEERLVRAVSIGIRVENHPSGSHFFRQDNRLDNK